MSAGGGFFLGTLGFLGTPLRERFAGTSSGSVIVSSVPYVISLSVPVSSLSLPGFEVHTSKSGSSMQSKSARLTRM